MNLKNNCSGKRILHAATPLVVALLAVACVEQRTIPTLPDVPVNIVFETDCPSTVDPNEVPTVNKASNQRIAWQAVDSTGTPVDKRYRIYFDPFKGQPLHANTHGYQRSPKFDDNIPTGVEYKYTIVGDDCHEKPLDPRFFVN